MNRRAAFILAGAGLGFFAGTSMGVAVGGTAYNAAYFLVPLGAFVGWLIPLQKDEMASNIESRETETPNRHSTRSDDSETKPGDGFGTILHSVLAILATIWNFHIDILRMLGVLPTFVRQPLLFLGMCIVISAFFPPFLAIYFFAWLAANHFGLSSENQFRVVIG